MISGIRGVYQTIPKWSGDRSFEFSDTTPRIGEFGGFVLTENTIRPLLAAIIMRATDAASG
jgi:hypothetical protein